MKFMTRKMQNNCIESVRPMELAGITIKTNTACGNVYVTLNRNADNQPAECFITMGKAGGCVSALMQAISGLIRVALKYKAPLDEIVSKLEGINCHKGTAMARCCIDGIAQSIRE